MDDSEPKLVKKKQEKPANILEEITIIEDKIAELQNIIAYLLEEQEDAIIKGDDKKEKNIEEQLVKTRKLLAIKNEQLLIKNSIAKINVNAENRRSVSIYESGRESMYLGEAKKKRVVVPSGLPKFRQGNTIIEPVEYIEQFQNLMEAHEVEMEKYSVMLNLCLDPVDGQWLRDWKEENGNEWKYLSKAFIAHFQHPNAMVIWQDQIHSLKMDNNIGVQRYTD
jgi:hypothetical protein